MHVEPQLHAIRIDIRKKCKIPEELKTGIEPVYNHDNFINIAKYTLQKAYIAAQNFVMASKIRNKTIYDKSANPIIVAEGDMVLVKKEPYKKHI